MNEQESRNGDSTPSDSGFDWFAESEALRDKFTEYSPKKVRKYNTYSSPAPPPTVPTDRNSIYSADDLLSAYNARSGERARNEQRQNSGQKKRAAAQNKDSVYSHSASGRKKSAPAKEASGGKTAKNKNQKSDRKKSSQKKAAEKKSGQEKNEGRKKRENNLRQPSNRQTKSKAAAQRERRAEESRKRKVEKSQQSYNRARQSGKSEDELRKSRSKKKRRAKKAYIAVSVGAVCLFALVFAIVFCYTHGAPISTITVEGESLYSESDILEAAGINIGDNMLMIRQKKTNDTVTTLLPYISKVEVDYQLPDTLRLVITETTDKMYVVNGSTYICVDENDKVVDDTKKKVKGSRYKIEGLQEQEYTVGKNFEPDEKNGNKEKYETAKKIIAAIEKVGLKKCYVINVAQTDKIYIVYNSKVWMYFKSDSDFEYKLRFALKALEETRAQSIIASSDKCYIDLRLDNQAILKPGGLE